MAQFGEKSDSDKHRIVFHMDKQTLSWEASEAFGKRDGESEEFFRRLVERVYGSSLTSREEFERDMIALLKEVCDKADRFQLHYGGNSGYAWRKRKYPGKDWNWDWESEIPEPVKKEE